MAEGQDGPGRAENSAPEGGVSTRSPRSPLLIVLGLLAVAIAVAIAIWSNRSGDRSDASNANVSDSASAQPEVPKSGVEPTTEAQLARAFEAAFGKTGQAELTTGDDTRIFKPSRLLRSGDKYVLLSEGTNVSDCHACSGAVAIHYLRGQGDAFSLVGSWPALVPGLGYGNPPDWTVSADYNLHPTVYAEIGYTAQGCTSGGVSLTELRPDKPVQTELVTIHYDNQSGMGELDGQTINGTIGNIRRDTSFEVAYSGARSFTEKWVKKGDVYRPESGESKMPQC